VRGHKIGSIPPPACQAVMHEEDIPETSITTLYYTEKRARGEWRTSMPTTGPSLDEFRRFDEFRRYRFLHGRPPSGCPVRCPRLTTGISAYPLFFIFGKCKLRAHKDLMCHACTSNSSRAVSSLFPRTSTPKTHRSKLSSFLPHNWSALDIYPAVNHLGPT
jgi:hypothetical protein